MSINRVVALLTPLVFAPLAGTCAAWLAEHFPGVEIKADQLQEVFIAGALIALAPALQWLHGWQKHEARVAEQDAAVVRGGDEAAVSEPELVAEDDAPLFAEDELDLDDGFDLDLDLDLDRELELELGGDASANGVHAGSGA